jgi:hypothetical protein
MGENDNEPQPEELEGEDGELLPDREVMSTIWPDPEPIDPPLDAPEQPAPE